ncbi:hypothetical protein, partial [Klebsiella pneumoniae]|uniref:hypothetical protein n=1 Tax=Klebsiella pneumoniae TaxID=573 RepID=UPI003C743923
MTIEIKIEAHPDRGDMGQQVERAMSALGFYRSAAVVSSVSHTMPMQSLGKDFEAALDDRESLYETDENPVEQQKA